MGMPSEVESVAVIKALPNASPKSGANTFARTDSEHVENSSGFDPSLWHQETPIMISIKPTVLMHIDRPSLDSVGNNESLELRYPAQRLFAYKVFSVWISPAYRVSYLPSGRLVLRMLFNAFEITPMVARLFDFAMLREYYHKKQKRATILIVFFVNLHCSHKRSAGKS